MNEIVMNINRLIGITIFRVSVNALSSTLFCALVWISNNRVSNKGNLLKSLSSDKKYSRPYLIYTNFSGLDKSQECIKANLQKTLLLFCQEECHSTNSRHDIMDTTKVLWLLRRRKSVYGKD